MRSLLALVVIAVSLAVAPSAGAIVGGTEAAAGAWPWAAAVSWRTNHDGVFSPPDGKPDVPQVCTGSLVGERWVLTAAHCILDEGHVIGSPGSFILFEGATFQVVIGQTDVRNPSPENVYTADWTDVRSANPGNLVELKGDVALIRLDRPAPQTAIRIPGAGQSAESATLTEPGRSSTVVGWGLTDETAPGISDVLRQVDVPLVSDATCRESYPTIDFFFGISQGFDANTMICAGLPEGGKDSCQGDSGGPLMAATGESWAQIGVTSWGAGCARADKPGIYARLSGLFGFIVTSTANDPEAPTGLPRVTDPVASAVKKRSATVGATIVANGFATEYVIELGPNRRYRTATVRGYAGAGTTPQVVSLAAIKLKPGVTYHYRVTAINVAGVVRGPGRTFTTPS